MGKSVDIADAIEETRRLKRALCSEALGLTPDDVFEGEFLDREHLARLRRRLGVRLRMAGHTRGEEIMEALKRLEDVLSQKLPMPSEDDLCRRYSDGKLDARTVIHITGWSVDELYEACCRMGLSPTM